MKSHSYIFRGPRSPARRGSELRAGAGRASSAALRARRQQRQLRNQREDVEGQVEALAGHGAAERQQREPGGAAAVRVRLARQDCEAVVEEAQLGIRSVREVAPRSFPLLLFSSLLFFPIQEVGTAITILQDANRY